MKEYRDLKQYARGYVAIDLDAICFNMDQMKQKIAPNTKVLGVIKTDGYGHGAVPIAQVLENREEIWGYATATPEEAYRLIDSGVAKNILILGYTFPYCYDRLVQEQIRPAVFREDMLSALSSAATSQKMSLPIHIKVDTGMSRIGIRPDNTGLAFVKKALETPGIIVEGIFTHFARADESDKTSAQKQLHLFQSFCQRIETELDTRIPLQHCSNSAGILEMKDANMDLVRAGITLYGLWPSDEIDKTRISLKPALSWYSHIAYLKEIQSGDCISYGGTYQASKPMKIATIPIGYGDGYPRSLSNQGYVLIGGKKAPIVGRVCMDQFMVDVTNISAVQEGDMVTLLGTDCREEITMETLGKLSGRFNYELACDIGRRMPRVYYKDKQIIGCDEFH
ncbi:MAG: alanine racemase [Lachnospiraceae bacterium]|nr:alanine racemase [Lachnospiraceae bacterium]